MTENKLILHIGQTKTGTTSIQSFLHANQMQMERSGIHYVKRPLMSTSHRYLFHLINASVPDLADTTFGKKHFQKLQSYLPEIVEPSIDKYWDYFEKNIFKIGCNISIISEELLWELGKFRSQSRSSMLRIFASHLHNIVKPEQLTIVVALRHHTEWLESWHNQMIKDQGNQLKISPFFEKEILLNSFNYSKYLDDWLKAFPKAIFKVVDFKTSLVNARPIGINFLDIAKLTENLIPSSLINMYYPEKMQESIHPILHAYIMRNKPAINDLSIYKERLKKADLYIRAMLVVLGIDYEYTVMNKAIIEKCDLLSKKDNLIKFNVNNLKSSIHRKKLVPGKLHDEIITSMKEKFFN